MMWSSDHWNVFTTLDKLKWENYKATLLKETAASVHTSAPWSFIKGSLNKSNSGLKVGLFLRKGGFYSFLLLCFSRTLKGLETLVYRIKLTSTPLRIETPDSRYGLHSNKMFCHSWKKLFDKLRIDRLWLN